MMLMKILEKHKGRIKKIVGFILFWFIVFRVTCSLTYLFRGNQFNYNDRISVVGIKEEPDTLDVICVGGSATFVYWEPLKAYNDYGFTSYNLATNTIQAESILAYIKYAQKYQNPDLYVVGIRAFQYYTNEGSEVGLRVTSDALEMGYNRISLVHEYLKNRTMDADKLALYWDLAKYHTNYDALSSPIAWKLMDNSTECDYKGCQIQTAWCYLEESQNFQTNVRTDLMPKAKETLTKLLDYCKENKLNVLFVVCPYSITQSDYSIYNSVGDIVSSYGYGFLNTNDYYKEMNINFAQDFCNKDHVNSFGADKYTAFLAKYLAENYELPDHRDDAEYSEWNDLAHGFLDFVDGSKSGVQSIINSANEAVAMGDTIRASDDFSVWSNLINDSRYSVIAVGNASTFDDLSYLEKKMLTQIGLHEFIGRESGICVSSDGSIIEADFDGRGSITVNIGFAYTVPCIVDDTNQMNSITINGTEYSLKNPNGLNVVVFDNYYRTIIDTVTLINPGSGNVLIMR